MSFKRDGDDLSVLNMLKHQRVSDLLGSHIPEDEAKLLSNGRLTCTVCYHRPIFDTVAMLGKHRKGKKHILELSRYLKRKEELELDALKKIQFESVKNEMSMQSIISSRLLGCGERKHSHSESIRRKSLELPSFSQEPPSLSVSTERSMTPSPRSSASQVRRYLKTLHRKRSLENLVEQKRENYGRPEKVGASNTDGSTPEIFEPLKENVNTSETFLAMSRAYSLNKPDEIVDASNTDGSAPELLEPLKEKANTSEPLLPVNRTFSLNLSGWIKDKDGKWVKDPNAEFDSDEDSPPI